MKKNRISEKSKSLKKSRKKALVVYITAGFPNAKSTLKLVDILVDQGVDFIELGMPFSDPIADGPVIQRSTLRAMKNRVLIRDILQLVKRFREKSNTPVVMMGYYNPIIRYGPEFLIQDCVTYGVDGLIIADLPFEEGEEIEDMAKAHDISLIYLLAPDIDPLRTESIVRASSGFIYCRCRLFSFTDDGHEWGLYSREDWS